MNNLHTNLLIKKSTTQNFYNVFIINLSIVFKCNVLTELLLTKTFTKKGNHYESEQKEFLNQEPVKFPYFRTRQKRFTQAKS